MRTHDTGDRLVSKAPPDRQSARVESSVVVIKRMDRATILAHLMQTERHVAQGESTVQKQRALISRLDKDGHDTTEARKLLGQFEELQALHLADRDRLRAKLASTDG